MDLKNFWVYILLCENNSYYTGYTVNISLRLKAHRAGTSGSKYTKSFKPLCLAQCWEVHGDKSLAMQIECYIKKLSRTKKNVIVASPEKLAKIFPVTSITPDKKFLLNSYSLSDKINKF